MIAWTSPLPTSRSMPLRISVSRWATGATRRPRMTSRPSSGFVPLVLVTTWSGSLERGGGESGRGLDRAIEGHDPLRDEVGQGHGVQRAGDRVADPDPQDVDRAASA